jgi:hypothetical protein
MVLHLGMSVCLSVRAHSSNTINPIDLKFLHKEGSTRGSVLLEFGLDSDPDSTRWLKKQATLFLTITLSNIDHFEYNLVQRSMNDQETKVLYNVRLT